MEMIPFFRNVVLMISWKTLPCALLSFLNTDILCLQVDPALKWILGLHDLFHTILLFHLRLEYEMFTLF